MSKTNYSTVTYYLFFFGLLALQGCATTMDTSELPENMSFGPANNNGYQKLVSITFSHPYPQMSDGEYLDMMVECVDESVDYERIELKDDSKMHVGRYTGTLYMGGNRDIVEGSDVIVGVNSDTKTVRAEGMTSYPSGLSTAFVKFGLTSRKGKNSDYILKFHSVNLALKDTGAISNMGFFPASNNPYQHPERIYEKTRLISEAINTCMTN